MAKFRHRGCSKGNWSNCLMDSGSSQWEGWFPIEGDTERPVLFDLESRLESWGRMFNMPGTEVVFPHAIPAEAIRVVR